MSNDYVPVIRDYPACFDSGAEYGRWVQMARHSPPTPGHSYCEDCTIEYQTAMIPQGRCGFPSTLFINNVGMRSAEAIHKLTGRRPYHRNAK